MGGQSLTITMNLIISTVIIKQCLLTASECPHPGALEHSHTISIPLNRAMFTLSFTRVYVLVCDVLMRSQ